MTQKSVNVTITGGLLVCEPPMSAMELLNTALDIAVSSLASVVLTNDNPRETAEDLSKQFAESLNTNLQRIITKEVTQ